MEQIQQAVEVVHEQAIHIVLAEPARAIQQHRRDAGGARTQHVEHVGVADVDGVVGDDVGTAQRRLEQRRIRLGQPHRGGDGGEVEVLDEVVVAQDQPQPDAPVGDDPQLEAALAQCREHGQRIWIERVALRLVEDGEGRTGALVHLAGRHARQARPNEMGEEADPGGLNGLLVAPRVGVGLGEAPERGGGGGRVLLQALTWDSMAALGTGGVSDIHLTRIGKKQREPDIEEDGLHGLRPGNRTLHQHTASLPPGARSPPRDTGRQVPRMGHSAPGYALSREGLYLRGVSRGGTRRSRRSRNSPQGTQGTACAICLTVPHRALAGGITTPDDDMPPPVAAVRPLALSEQPAPEPHRPGVVAAAPQHRALYVDWCPRETGDGVPAALTLDGSLDTGDAQQRVHRRLAIAKQLEPCHGLSDLLSAYGVAAGARRLGWWGALEYKPPLVQTVSNYLTHLDEETSRDTDVDEKLTLQ